MSLNFFFKRIDLTLGAKFSIIIIIFFFIIFIINIITITINIHTSSVYFILFFSLLRSHQWYMEVPRLGVTSELQLLAYTTATAMPDLSHVCDLPFLRPGIKPASSWRLCWVLNLLSHHGNSFFSAFYVLCILLKALNIVSHVSLQ